MVLGFGSGGKCGVGRGDAVGFGFWDGEVDGDVGGRVEGGSRCLICCGGGCGSSSSSSCCLGELWMGV